MPHTRSQGPPPLPFALRSSFSSSTFEVASPLRGRERHPSSITGSFIFRFHHHPFHQYHSVQVDVQVCSLHIVVVVFESVVPG
ncbi:hypothetical protein HanOQP8_Chr04g0160251 [Helianthus annuus]|nr:hypothetical protein HanOQP8_Chr04g0160251 [Helianthus annuus]